MTGSASWPAYFIHTTKAASREERTPFCFARHLASATPQAAIKAGKLLFSSWLVLCHIAENEVRLF